MSWRQEELTDNHKVIDIIYSRKIINFWLFGWVETIRVVQFKPTKYGTIYADRTVIYNRFFWIRNSFYNTILGWEVNKFFQSKWSLERRGSIEDFVDEFPFILKHSHKLIRQKKINNLLTKSK